MDLHAATSSPQENSVPTNGGATVSGSQSMPSSPQQRQSHVVATATSQTTPGSPLQVVDAPVPQDVSQGISSNAIASDEDTANSSDIEAQWVAKAKAVIAQTAIDPYEQSKQISKLKIEYNYGRDNGTTNLPQNR